MYDVLSGDDGNRACSDRRQTNFNRKSTNKKVNKRTSNSVEQFFFDISKQKNTTRPQVVASYEKLVDRKPIIRLKVFNREVRALFDTGAQSTVLNSEFLKHTDHTIGRVPMTMSSPLSDNQIEAFQTGVSMSLGGVEFTQAVCVGPIDTGGQFEMLLGYDMMRRHEAIDDITNKKIRFAIDDVGRWEDQMFDDRLNVVTTYDLVATGKLKSENSNLHKIMKVKDLGLTPTQQTVFRGIIDKFESIMIEDVTKIPGSSVAPYEPTFKSNTPVYERQYRIPHSMLAPLREKIDLFEKAGIVAKASSPWNSPVLAVKKDNGKGVRMVLDLRKLNEIIEPLPYPLMRIEDILQKLNGSKIFSNLDVNNGYYNIKLADNVKDRFCFTTPWGRYRLERLPQGLINGAAVFQMTMNNALHELIGEGKVSVFQDDILVHTSTIEEHLEVLQRLFAKLKQINMAVRPSKCSFFKRSVKFLGHIVDELGSRPAGDNIEAIKKFPRPHTVRQVRSFLGSINFYRKFIQGVTEIAAPLYSLIKKDRTKIQWTQECEAAFVNLKLALISNPVLVHPDFSKPFIIKCDASDIGVGGVLEQEIGGELHPVGYCSRKLNGAERNYSVIEKEALAIIYTLKQFRHLIFGYPIVLKTDHKPLSYVWKLKDTHQRLVRWFLQIQDYNLKIEYIPGKFNLVADMLSRSDETASIVNIININDMGKVLSNKYIGDEQRKDDYCQSIIKNIEDDKYKDDEFVLDDNMVLLKKVFPDRRGGWRYRIVAPPSIRKDVMFNYHDRIGSGHFSLPTVLYKVKHLFTWDGMFTDIKKYVQSCEKCQRRNLHKVKAPFQPVTPPSRPMQRLSCDILGPFNRSIHKKNKYLVLWVDHLTRYCWASPIPNMEAHTIVEDYVENIFSRHGGSKEIVTDNGTQFTSELFQLLCKKLGTRSIMTTTYHPCANGVSERLNSRIIAVLSHICNKYFNNWDELIPFVLFSIRNSPHKSTGDTPFYLFHGFDPVDPLVEASATPAATYDTTSEYLEVMTSRMECARAEVEANLMRSSRANCQARNSSRRLREFNVGEKVLYLDKTSFTGKNRKLKQRYLGPYRVTDRTGLVNYRIRNVNPPHDVKSTHVDKLKAYTQRYEFDDVNLDGREEEEPQENVILPLVDDPLPDEEEETEYLMTFPNTNQQQNQEMQPESIDIADGEEVGEPLEEENEISGENDLEESEQSDLRVDSPVAVDQPMPPGRYIPIPVKSDYDLRSKVNLADDYIQTVGYPPLRRNK